MDTIKLKVSWNQFWKRYELNKMKSPIDREYISLDDIFYYSAQEFVGKYPNEQMTQKDIDYVKNLHPNSKEMKKLDELYNSNLSKAINEYDYQKIFDAINSEYAN